MLVFRHGFFVCPTQSADFSRAVRSFDVRGTDDWQSHSVNPCIRSTQRIKQATDRPSSNWARHFRVTWPLCQAALDGSSLTAVIRCAVSIYWSATPLTCTSEKISRMASRSRWTERYQSAAWHPVECAYKISSGNQPDIIAFNSQAFCPLRW